MGKGGEIIIHLKQPSVLLWLLQMAGYEGTRLSQRRHHTQALCVMRAWHCHAWTEGCSRAISSTHSLSTFRGLLGAGRTYTTLG